MTALRVRDLMTRNVQTVETGDDLDFASMVMRLERFRHLPVVEDGRLVGIVSDRDVIRSQAGALTGLPPEDRRMLDLHVDVREMMTANPETIGPDALALEAAQRLRERRFGCLPVVEDGRLVGILTETDFLDLAIRELSDPSR